MFVCIPVHLHNTVLARAIFMTAIATFSTIDLPSEDRTEMLKSYSLVLSSEPTVYTASNQQGCNIYIIQIGFI